MLVQIVADWEKGFWYSCNLDLFTYELRSLPVFFTIRCVTVCYLLSFSSLQCNFINFVLKRPPSFLSSSIRRYWGFFHQDGQLGATGRSILLKVSKDHRSSFNLLNWPKILFPNNIDSFRLLPACFLSSHTIEFVCYSSGSSCGRRFFERS